MDRADKSAAARESVLRGHAQLADGRVFLVGGGGGDPHNAHDKAFIFKPAQPGNPWTEVDTLPLGPPPTMLPDQRWYATATTLGTGDVLLVAGRSYVTLCNDTLSFQDYPLIFDPDAIGTADPQWTRLSHPNAQKVVHNYPFMFQLSDQTVFMGGGTSFTPTFPPTIHLDTYRLHPALGVWGPTPIARAAAPGGSAVMYRPNKVVKAGTGSPCGTVADTTSQVEVIDVLSASPAWNLIDPMQHARRHFYLIAMPDGRVLAVGGHTQVGTQFTDVLVPEWIDLEAVDPSWQLLAAMSRPRTYHSSGVLLPDGRVFMAGTGPEGHYAAGMNCEFFRPPYLFDALDNDNSTLRPRIDASQTPDVLEYGKGVNVYLDTNYPHAVDGTWKVSLIRLGAATHGIDQDQRFMWLQFVPQPAQNRLRVAAPAHANLAPPGYYMLFVLKPGDRTGIPFPSIAKIVQLK